MPDFHETPGAGKGGRSVSVLAYDGRKLGPWVDRLRPPLDVVSLWGMGIAGGAAIGHVFNATPKPRSALYAAGRIARHLRDRVTRGRGMQLVNGNALVARLMRSALDKGMTLRDSALLRGDRDRVTGARLATPQGRVTVTAARGVVLATGGLPHDPTRLEQWGAGAGGGHGHFSAALATNSGDGIRLAEGAGARVDGTLASNIALAPVSLVPRADGTVTHFPHLIERAKPGIIAVTPDGRRFVSEADSSHDFMQAMLAATPPERQFCWLIADHKAQRRWGLGWSKPFPLPLRPAIRCGYLKRGRSIADLARACDIPGGTLAETGARFNAAAARGTDPEFHRGVSAYHRVQGDAAHGPNPSLAPLLRGPFYAVRIVPGIRRACHRRAGAGAGCGGRRHPRPVRGGQ